MASAGKRRGGGDRYTNTQNAVREKDFIALNTGFQGWARQLAEQYQVYLEIQRGGWDSRRLFQRQNPSAPQYARYANAFDLLKVYGAAWFREAGLAYGRNQPFLTDGALFKQITDDNQESDEPFGVNDLYAAYLLQGAADDYRFGRGADVKQTRKQTRYLFYLVVVELLRDVMVRAGLPNTRREVTRSLLCLFAAGQEAARDALLSSAIDIIDEYLTPADTPNLRGLLAVSKRSLGHGKPAPRDLITSAIRPAAK